MQSFSCIYGGKDLYICLYSHFWSSCSYPETCQHFSLFQTNLQMCRDNFPGCFREADCLVKRSCLGSLLFQGMQQELLGWLQKELIQEAALINAPSTGGACCQSLEKCIGDQFNSFSQTIWFTRGMTHKVEMDCMTWNLEIVRDKAITYKEDGHWCGEDLSPLVMLWTLLKLYLIFVNWENCHF